MLQGMERGKVLDFWVWAVFFQKLAHVTVSARCDNPSLLSLPALCKIPSISSLSFRVFTLCCGSRVTETSL